MWDKEGKKKKYAGEEVTATGGVLGSVGTGGASRWVLHPPGVGDVSALWEFAVSESREALLLQKRSLQLGGKSSFGWGECGGGGSSPSPEPGDPMGARGHAPGASPHPLPGQIPC